VLREPEIAGLGGLVARLATESDCDREDCAYEGCEAEQPEQGPSVTSK
jgi:hypothetical protein